MNDRCQRIIYLVVLLLLLPLFGCSLKYTPRSAEEFERESLRLEKRARTHEDPAARAEAQLELACLYLHYRNPQLNYGRALQEFEVYLNVTAADRQNDEIQNWLHALREMERQERETARLKENLAVLTQETAHLKGSLAALTQETAHLKDNVAGLTREKEESRHSLALELRKNRELQTALDAFQAQLESLERTTRSLKEANGRMKQIVEKLKNLDFQREDKRKAIQ
jgi:prefoldin subunit 5